MKAEEITLSSQQSKLGILMLIILVLALLVRFIGISEMPFTVDDAQLAADALAIANNGSIGSSSLPAYTGFTSLLFYVFGSSNFVARIVPVFAGVSIVYAAFLIMKRYNNRVAIFFAVALALDWILVSMSRQINTPLIALAAVYWAYHFYQEGKLSLSGLFLGIAFLGGYSFWVFLLGLLVIFLIARLRKVEVKNIFLKHSYYEQKEWIKFVLVFLVTVVVISTGFFLNPTGLGNIGSGLLHFFKLFLNPYQLPFYHSLYIVLKHMFLPLIGTLVFVFINLKDHRADFNVNLIWIVLFGLIMTMLMGRNDLGLATIIVIPLWAFTAQWLSCIALEIEDKKALKVGAIALLIVLMTYVGMTLSGLSKSSPGNSHFVPLSIAALAGVLLIVVLIWLGSLVFETHQSLVLFASALVLVLAVVSIGQTFNSLKENTLETQLSLNHGPVLLANTSQLSSLDVFESYGLINNEEATIRTEGINQDLRWILRDYKVNKASLNPELIISASEKLPNFSEPYRGMRVEYSRTIPWQGMNFQTLLKSLISPIKNWQIEGAFFWAQTKLFSGAINK